MDPRLKPDYDAGNGCCALVLSLKYHSMHREYIFSRIAKVGRDYVVRVLIAVVDVSGHEDLICDVTRIALMKNFTLILTWSPQEAARYIESLKRFERKSPDSITRQEAPESDIVAVAADALREVPAINSTDAETLLSAFGTFAGVLEAHKDELVVLPGIGPAKVRRLLAAFDEPL